MPLICVLWTATALARPKTDKITVKNGDTVTCEIKTLSRGKLTAKTDDMGTLDIKWTEVVGLESEFRFRVETSNGDYYYGSLSRETGSNMLVVAGMTSVSLEALDVVAILPLERSFWDRNDGSMSFGFNFTKGSDVRQLTFDWTNLYRAERNVVNIRANANFTKIGKDKPTTTQTDFTTTFYRLLDRKKWTGSLSLSFPRNDELGLKRRVLIGIGTGLNAIKSNRNTLLMSVGLALNSELGADTTNATESLEAVFTASYAFFRYNTPKTDISTSVSVFPSLTEKGRVRMDYNLKYSHELITDFTANLTFFTNYDNKPATEGASTTDWGITFGFCWSY
jgi:hypothetical protein